MASISTLSALRIIESKNIRFLTEREARNLFGFENINSLYKFLQRLEKNKVIRRVSKGKYVTEHVGDFEVANFIVQPSYISFESALSYHGVLSQFPYTVTSATTGKTKSVLVGKKEFEFCHIAAKMFCGYLKDKNFLIADREKSLIDIAYFSMKGLKGIDWDELDLTELDKNKLEKYIVETKVKDLGHFMTVKGII